MEQGFVTGAPDLDGEREHRRGAGGGMGEDAGPVQVRGHRQGARLPRLPRAARPARLDRPQQRRPPRHAPPEHRRRGGCRAQAVRVRRHAEPRSERHDPQRRAAAARRRPARARDRAPAGPRHRGRLPGPDGRAERVPELLRDGHHARLQPQHDPLRRGSLHAGQARGAGAGAPDSHAVSRRLAARRAVPRLGRGDPAQAARARARRPVLHEHARRPAPGAPHPRAAEEGHAADRDDHRRQAVGAHPRRTARSTRTPSASTRTSSPRRSPR